MVQFLSINFFLDFFNFCWVFQEFPFFCVTLYQVSHRYGIFSWWWAHSCPKHVEKSNKHIKKICAPIFFYLEDYTRMHSQQNMKFPSLFDVPCKCNYASYSVLVWKFVWSSKGRMFEGKELGRIFRLGWEE